MENEFNFNNLTTLLTILQEAKINMTMEVSKSKKVCEIDYLTFSTERLEIVFGKHLYKKTLTQAQVDMFRKFIYETPLNNDNFLKKKEIVHRRREDEQMKSVRLKAIENVDNLSPSTPEEIAAFNPIKGDKFEIEIVTHCPFTWIDDVTTVAASVNDEMIWQDNPYGKYFEFVDDHGQDSYCTFGCAKIIKKI